MANTISGTDVVVVLDYGVTITFDEVTQSGVTDVDVTTLTPRIPIAWMLGTPKRIYNITTSALYTGNITITIDYSAMTFSVESALVLLKLTSIGWTDITDSEYPDTTNDIIQGTTTSLSYFAIVEPSDVAASVLAKNTATITMLDPQHGGRVGAYTYYYPETFTLTPLNMAISHDMEAIPEEVGGYTTAQYTMITMLRDSLPWEPRRGDRISIYQECDYVVDNNLRDNSKWFTRVIVSPLATTTSSTFTTTTTTTTTTTCTTTSTAPP